VVSVPPLGMRVAEGGNLRNLSARFGAILDGIGERL
jgi:hypothetical protein